MLGGLNFSLNSFLQLNMCQELQIIIIIIIIIKDKNCYENSVFCCCLIRYPFAAVNRCFMVQDKYLGL